MPDQYYKEAARLAQKEFRACITKGEHPYLPLLDDFLPPERLHSGTDLGICQVPTELIVGTRTNARANAFARNFMPLLQESSEFALKWEALCAAHLDEGIRDPIRAYEYMNRFYVEEGNKRVSVLKFFDAPVIAAHVTRILPERSAETALYYEFLEYYRCTKLNFPEFSKPGSYAQLLRLLGTPTGEIWNDAERSAFSAAYYYFRLAYEASGGKRLHATVGDAMLAYIKIYGYAELRGKSAAEIRRSVNKAWEEFTLQQQEQPIDIKLAPTEEKTGSLLAKILPRAEPKPLKVAFVYDKAPATSNWAYAHELGRRHVAHVFPEIETTAYENAMQGDPLAVLERAIAEGNTVLFTASPRLLPASLRAAVEYPKVTILNCSLNQSHRYIRTYYARMYEVKFIIGAIAGVLSGGAPVGYICDYPIYGQIAGINAFALGVQMVDPTTRVHLAWSSVGGLVGARERLHEKNIHLISSQDLTRPSEGGDFGLYLEEGGERNMLARPVWKWGKYYEALLRRIRDKSLQAEYADSCRALNYYWGLSADVVNLHCSEKLPGGVRRLAAMLTDGIRGGNCDIFLGPLHDQNGRLILTPGQRLDVEQIINMDYLVENVVGEIPAYNDFSETGKDTVRIAGVAGVARE